MRFSASLMLFLVSVSAWAQDYAAERGPGGKPDLNGIWQFMNRASFRTSPPHLNKTS